MTARKEKAAHGLEAAPNGTATNTCTGQTVPKPLAHLMGKLMNAPVNRLSMKSLRSKLHRWNPNACDVFHLSNNQCRRSVGVDGCDFVTVKETPNNDRDEEPPKRTDDGLGERDGEAAHNIPNGDRKICDPQRKIRKLPLRIVALVRIDDIEGEQAHRSQGDAPEQNFTRYHKGANGQYSSTTVATERADCNRDGLPPFAAANG